mgnify:CR=1 FL=1
MRLDEEGLFSLALESVALEIARSTPGDLVADAFCGAGGSAIGFARAGKSVAAIDISAPRLAMARYNASLFGVSESVRFINGDCMKVIPGLAPDSIFLDPPWGGTDYIARDTFILGDFEPDGRALLDMAFSVTDSVVIRLPKNFQMSELEGFGRKYRLEENRLDGKLLHYCAYFE